MSIGVSDHPQKDQIKALWQAGHRTKYILDWLDANDFPPVKPGTLESYCRRYFNDKTISIDVDEVEAEALETVLQKLHGGTIKKIVEEEKVYDGWERVDEHSPALSKKQTSKTRRVEIVPDSSQDIPLERSPQVNVTLPYHPTLFRSEKAPGWSVGVFLPDMQIGYCKTPDGSYIESHDERAIDLTHQVMVDLEASFGLDMVVLAGDNLDFPEFSSKFSTAPGAWNTTQLAIDRYGLEVGIIDSIATQAEKWSIPGNHESRLYKYLQDNAPPLLGLRRYGEIDPLLTIPHLCRFEDYGFKEADPYPHGEVWANDWLRFEHGKEVSGTPGGTAPKYLKHNVNTLIGHVHRRELVSKTIATRFGNRQVEAGSPGCLCKITGEVPSSRTMITANGTQPTNALESWQQGFTIFWYETEGEQRVHLDHIQIWDGHCIVYGKHYYANEEAIESLRT